MSRYISLVFLLSLVVLCMSASKHPLYISVTECEYNAKEKTLEISSKVFTTDLESILKKQNPGLSVDLLHPADKKIMEKIVEQYFQAHLNFNVAGRKAALRFLGYEQSEECIIAYFQSEEVPAFNRITVTDSLLYEYNSGQVSIIHMTINGDRKSTKLNNPDASVVFTY